MAKDIIEKRADAGKCPICNEYIKEGFKVIFYKGKKIWVCKGHEPPYVKDYDVIPLKELQGA